MNSLELKWGLIIGLAGMIWLYVSYYLGLHTNGLFWVQIMCLIGFGISLAGYIAGLVAIKMDDPEMEYLEGVKSGAIIAGVVAVIALITQFGYFKLVNPGFTQFMVEETKLYYSKSGLTEEQVNAAGEQALKSFSFESYLMQASLGAVVMGIIFSAIIMLFLARMRFRNSERSAKTGSSKQ